VIQNIESGENEVTQEESSDNKMSDMSPKRYEGLISVTQIPDSFKTDGNINVNSMSNGSLQMKTS